MAHVEKYSKYDTLCRHYERAKNKNGEYIKFKNLDIDLTKTHSNYNLAVFQKMPQSKFIKKRLSEVKVLQRENVNVMCDWIVTLPKGMESDEQKFFEETFKFLTKKYGQENVISAYVHLDEAQPHLHFAFIPVTVDKKKNIKKVSAKEVLTRNELQRFHTDLDNYLTSVFGRSTGVLNDVTKEGNKSIEELKRGTAVKELGEKKEELKIIEGKIDKLKWPDKIKPLKEKNDTVIISKSALQSANEAITKKVFLESKAEDADKILKTDYRIENFRLRNLNLKLGRDYSALVSEKDALQNKLNNFYSVFQQNPDFFEEFMRLLKAMELAAIAENHMQKQVLREQAEM